MTSRSDAREPKSTRRAKGDPLAAMVASAAPELAQLLHDSWPGLNADGTPDGGYAMARGVVAELLYSELARAHGMHVAQLELGAPADMQGACGRLRERIRQMPVADLTPDHFGCVHEALAGFHLERGQVVANDGRRGAGVHYTPPHLATRVTVRTIEPLLQCIGDQSPLVLRVCDPAVGAGAFMLALMRMLAPLVLERGDASTLDEAKRLVAMHCCYGVDKSRYAVHSCRLAMTLEARACAMPRSWLDDNIKHGDALVGLDRGQLTSFHWKAGQGSIPGVEALFAQAIDGAVAARIARLEGFARAARPA